MHVSLHDDMASSFIGFYFSFNIEIYCNSKLIAPDQHTIFLTNSLVVFKWLQHRLHFNNKNKRAC